MTVTATGYELVQADFLAMAQAELVSSYEDIKAYIEVNPGKNPTAHSSVKLPGGWAMSIGRALTALCRSGAAVYHFTLASVQDQFENYRPTFNELLAKSGF